MSRLWLLRTVEVLLVAAAVAYLGLPIVDAPVLETAALIGLLVFLLAVLPIELPLGDIADLTAPLFVAGLLVGAPAATVLTTPLFVGLGRALRPARRSLDSVVDGVTITAASTSISALLWGMLDIGPVAGNALSYGLRIASLAIGYLVIDLALRQLHTSWRHGQPFWPLFTGQLRLLAWMNSAQVSVTCLAILVYTNMGFWALVLAAVLLLVIRQSFAALMEVRHAYRSTIEALVRAIEAQDPARFTHAVSVAALATRVGRDYGLKGKPLETLHYAALFHDVGLLGAEGPRKEDHPSEATHATDIVENVRFLAETVPVLDVLEGRTAQGKQHALLAYIIQIASDIDEGLELSMSAGTAEEKLGMYLTPGERRRISIGFRRALLSLEIDPNLASAV